MQSSWKDIRDIVDEKMKDNGYTIEDYHGARSLGFYDHQAKKGFMFVLDNFDRCLEAVKSYCNHTIRISGIGFVIEFRPLTDVERKERELLKGLNILPPPKSLKEQEAD